MKYIIEKELLVSLLNIIKSGTNARISYENISAILSNVESTVVEYIAPDPIEVVNNKEE